MSKETSPQVGVMGLVSPVQIVQRLGIAEFGVGRWMAPNGIDSEPYCCPLIGRFNEWEAHKTWQTLASRMRKFLQG